MDINYENLNAFHTTISAAFQNALAAAPPSQWRQVATEVPSSSDHNDYPFFGESHDLREWKGERIAREMSSYKYQITNRKFEGTLKASRTQIEDDQGGLVAVYAARAAAFARAAARHQDQLMFGEIIPAGTTSTCFDGQYFFDTDHPTTPGNTQSNHMGGSGTAWYLLDLNQPFKPFILQMRKAPELVSKTALTDDRVFFNDEFLWGVDARYNGGYGMWQSAIYSKQTLSGANYDAAQDRFATFVSDNGVKMGARGTALLYPSSLRTTVRDLFAPTVNATGATNVYAAENLQLIECSWL